MQEFEALSPAARPRLRQNPSAIIPILHPPTMIIRIVRGRVRKSAEAEFHRRVHASLPVLRAVPGLIDVRVGRQRDADTEQFVFVSQWRDLESLYRWVGGNDLLRVPAIPAGYEELLDECNVQHYEDFEPEFELPE